MVYLVQINHFWALYDHFEHFGRFCGFFRFWALAHMAYIGKILPWGPVEAQGSAKVPHPIPYWWGIYSGDTPRGFLERMRLLLGGYPTFWTTKMAKNGPKMTILGHFEDFSDFEAVQNDQKWTI